MPFVPDYTRVLRGKGVFVLILVQVFRDTRENTRISPLSQPCSKDKLLGERQACEE